MELRRLLFYKNIISTRQIPKYIVGLFVLLTIASGIWAVLYTISGDRQVALQIPFLGGATEKKYLLNKREIQRCEQEDVNFIHTVLGEYYTGLKEEEEEMLAWYIYQEGNKQGLDPFLLVAMIQVESTFHNFSESYMGAQGLMQILPSVGRSIARENQIKWEGDGTLFNPKKNIRIGVSYLKKLVEQFNDIHLALAAYNLGPTALKNHLRSGRPVPSFYAKKVMSYYQDLQKRTRRETG